MLRIVPRLAVLFSRSPKPITGNGYEFPPSGRHITPIALFLVAQIALGAVLAATSGLLVMHLRERALITAEHHLQSISLILANQADRAFEAVELVQTALLERFDVASMHTPQDFNKRMSGIAVHEELLSRSNTLPQLDALTAIDADGNLVNFSRS